MWERLKNVKLKRYREHRPAKSVLPYVLVGLLLVFSLVIVGRVYQLFAQSTMPFCDSYGNEQKNCLPCPQNEYCIDGKIYNFSDSSGREGKWRKFTDSLKSAIKQSLIALLSFGILVLIIYALNYRKQWIDKQIKVAEVFYKELLLELKESPNGMIRKSAFSRKFDQNYSPGERKFLEARLEEIRRIDEQVTYVNDEGELNYIFLSE